MIRAIDESGLMLFVLDTHSTTYAMKVTDTGHLEHLYYGSKITIESSDGLVMQKQFAAGNSSVVDEEHTSMSLDEFRLEFSGVGKGDMREPAIELVNQDGSATTDLRYDSYEIVSGKQSFGSDMPGSYAPDNAVSCLRIKLKDNDNQLEVILNYWCYGNDNVITRQTVLTNNNDGAIRIKRLMSTMLDFDAGDYTFHTFTGAWTREMNKTSYKLVPGKHLVSSSTGTSSSRANPFVMISDSKACEEYGKVWGFNLIYSGNHYECCDVSPFGMRFVSGINPSGFEWELGAGESFESPEAVMCFSREGFGGLSYILHEFINSRIVRGDWKEKLRPVLLNSWEASYFNITEGGLVKLARKAASVGIELLVMDDGWFGERDDDTSSLGDWTANKHKLPHGVAGLASKINKLGLQFGIWVEPEMVSENSNLYRAHPDWAVKIPGKAQSLGRHQMILDLTREEVCNYVIESMSELFSSANIAYVKWDMNRNFTDTFSSALSSSGRPQGEFSHRYVLGLYKVMRTLTERFPKILFEGCASGGNRFDLGILSYFPQIWASDDTDAICRAEIQTSYSYCYPQSTITAHVSDTPNHQTLSSTPLDTRFNIASFAVLGYELNLSDMSSRELSAISEQIAFYKQWRQVFQFGNFSRMVSLRDSFELRDGSVTAPGVGYDLSWSVASPDGQSALSMIMTVATCPNSQDAIVKARHLIPDSRYRVESRVIPIALKSFGSLINAAIPIHVKKDSLLHNLLARFAKMNSEQESHLMYGDAIMEAGVHVAPAFAATGYNDKVRFFPSGSSRLYIIKKA